MLKGFEEYTSRLTNGDTWVAITVSKWFGVGVGHAIKCSTIIKRLEMIGVSMQPARLRKIIHHIRTAKAVENLIATEKGYFIAENDEELLNYKLSLKQRISAQKKLLESYGA
jgi:hypothetical protein